MAVTAIKTTKNSIDSVREIVQDFLVPELKAIKTEINSVRTEMAMGFDAVRTEMRLRDEKQTERSNHRAENIRQISDKLDKAIDIRERLASLEARLPRSCAS